MLYHVSPTSGIKTLEPRTSTHGKPYVYAIENLVTGLLFGAPHDDFDFCISTDDSGIPCIVECYPNAMEIVFSGKSCSVYELPDTDFKRGMTGWDAELVCEHEVDAVRETAVPDLYSRLLDEERRGSLEIVHYTENEEKFVTSHVLDRLVRFNVNIPSFIEHDPRFVRYTAAVRSAIEKLYDGMSMPK